MSPDSAAQRYGSDPDASLPLVSVPPPDGHTLRAHGSGGGEPYLQDAVRGPLLKHSRLLAAIFLLTMVAVVAYRVLLVKREYSADAVIATVTNAKTVPALSGIAASLGAGTAQEGLSPTPDMMV